MRGRQVDLRARHVQEAERVAGGHRPRFLGVDDVVRHGGHTVDVGRRGPECVERTDGRHQNDSRRAAPTPGSAEGYDGWKPAAHAPPNSPRYLNARRGVKDRETSCSMSVLSAAAAESCRRRAGAAEPPAWRRSRQQAENPVPLRLERRQVSRGNRFAGRQQLLDGQRVDELPVPLHAVVQVRPGGHAARAHPPDQTRPGRRAARPSRRSTTGACSRSRSRWRAAAGRGGPLRRSSPPTPPCRWPPPPRRCPIGAR